VSKGRAGAYGYVVATVGNGVVCLVTWRSSPRWLIGILLASIALTAVASVATIYGCIKGWDKEKAIT